MVIGPTSSSLNFDSGSYPAGFNVSGEYGYGNMDGTGALTNFVSAHTPEATPFGGANRDGPVSINGLRAGLSPILCWQTWVLVASAPSRMNSSPRSRLTETLSSHMSWETW